MISCFKTPIFIAGLLFLAYYAYKIGYYFYATFIRKSSLGCYKKDGSWAVVTGATDGIGKAIAVELARKGFNMLLVSRTEQKLKDVIQNDLKDYKIETDYLTIDFSKAGDDDYRRLKEKISNRDIAVLVNNVGASYPYPEYFTALDDDFPQYIIKMNIESANRVTKVILPRMEEQKRGLILNISSGSSLGDAGCPLLSVYAASKAYMNNWSHGLNEEYKRKGIRVESLTPLYVTTKLSKIRKASFFNATPERYAKSALAGVGSYYQRSGFFPHDILLLILTLSPRPYISSFITKMHLNNRRRYLEKHKKDK